MPITITVENGSGVANANSYVTLVEAREYALNRGVVLSATDDTLAAQLIKANDYLESKACLYQGYRTSTTQSLQWPRQMVYLFDEYVQPTTIPNLLKNAQIQLAMAVNAGYDLQPNYQASDFVKREKVDVIETEYADPLSVGIAPSLTAVDALLAPLFGNCEYGTGMFRTIRV